MIDAKTLPYTMYADTGYTLQVSSGSMSITSDGKWVSKFVTSENVAGNISTYNDSTFGTWTHGSAAATALFKNTETNVTSNGSWTAADVTVDDVDGTVVRKIVYKKN